MQAREQQQMGHQSDTDAIQREKRKNCHCALFVASDLHCEWLKFNQRSLHSAQKVWKELTVGQVKEQFLGGSEVSVK